MKVAALPIISAYPKYPLSRSGYLSSDAVLAMLRRAPSKNDGKLVVEKLYPIPVRIIPSEIVGYLATRACVRTDP